MLAVLASLTLTVVANLTVGVLVDHDAARGAALAGASDDSAVGLDDLLCAGVGRLVGARIVAFVLCAALSEGANESLAGGTARLQAVVIVVKTII